MLPPQVALPSNSTGVFSTNFAQQATGFPQGFLSAPAAAAPPPAPKTGWETVTENNTIGELQAEPATAPVASSLVAYQQASVERVRDLGIAQDCETRVVQKLELLGNYLHRLETDVMSAASDLDGEFAFLAELKQSLTLLLRGTSVSVSSLQTASFFSDQIHDLESRMRSVETAAQSLRSTLTPATHAGRSMNGPVSAAAVIQEQLRQHGREIVRLANAYGAVHADLQRLKAEFLDWYHGKTGVGRSTANPFEEYRRRKGKEKLLRLSPPGASPASGVF